MDNQETDRKEDDKSSATCVLQQRRLVQLNMRTGSKKNASYCLFLVKASQTEDGNSPARAFPRLLLYKGPFLPI